MTGDVLPAEAERALLRVIPKLTLDEVKELKLAILSIAHRAYQQGFDDASEVAKQVLATVTPNPKETENHG